jgi:DNA-binding transcriptional ArsR family regulator
MKTMHDFIVSRVRVEVLEWFFTHASDMFYVREVTRAVKEEINAVRRELDRLHNCGLLVSEKRGNRVYYQLNSKYPFYQELLRMVAKNSGLGLKLRKLEKKLGDKKLPLSPDGLKQRKHLTARLLRAKWKEFHKRLLLAPKYDVKCDKPTTEHRQKARAALTSAWRSSALSVGASPSSHQGSKTSFLRITPSTSSAWHAASSGHVSSIRSNSSHCCTWLPAIAPRSTLSTY